MSGERFSGREFRPTKAYLEARLRQEQDKVSSRNESLRALADAVAWFMPAMDETSRNLSIAHGDAEVREYRTRLLQLHSALRAARAALPAAKEDPTDGR